MNFVLLGICWDEKIGQRWERDKRSPLNASIVLRKYFQEIETFVSGVDFEKVFIKNLGNIRPKNFNEMLRQTSEKLKGQGFPIIIGGNHTISYAGVKALKPKTFVSFDAHPDCEPIKKVVYLSVSRHIFEDSHKVVLYGTRCFSKNEFEYLKNKKIKIASLNDLKKLEGPIYLSIDFDVLDPSLIPTVVCPEPNGLTFKQVINGVKILAKKLVAVDFVEFTPINSDINKTYALIAGKLIYSTIAEIIKNRNLSKK